MSDGLREANDCRLLKAFAEEQLCRLAAERDATAVELDTAEHVAAGTHPPHMEMIIPREADTLKRELLESSEGGHLAMAAACASELLRLTSRALEPIIERPHSLIREGNAKIVIAVLQPVGLRRLRDPYEFSHAWQLGGGCVGANPILGQGRHNRPHLPGSTPPAWDPDGISSREDDLGSFARRAAKHCVCRARPPEGDRRRVRARDTSAVRHSRQSHIDAAWDCGSDG